MTVYHPIPQPVCPNCRGSSFKERWVEKVGEKKEPTTIALKDYGKKKAQMPPPSFIVGATIEWPTYIQLVLECNECGYTEVVPIPEAKK